MDLRCMVSRLLAVIQQYGDARGSSFHALLADARKVASGCEPDVNGQCNVARLAALTRENAALQESLDASRDTCASLTMDLADERARAEKARGNAVAALGAVHAELLSATADLRKDEADEPGCVGDDCVIVADGNALQRAIELCATKLRALAHDEGRGTPAKPEKQES